MALKNTDPFEFRPQVWAPNATRVDLLLPGLASEGNPATTHPMAAAGHPGWWGCDVVLPEGTDYGFSLDGGPLRPDPRSAHQPDGVHGPSRVFDPAFTWTDASWPGRDVRGQVIYEAHVGTFTPGGTLDSAIERLGHLADLGVGVVELMPVAAFTGRWGWGYDGVGLYAVHAPYRGPRALQRFVDAAHAHGIAVALDVVYNHLGPAGNYLAEFGPYFTEAHHTPWGAAVNLDQEGATEVRAWIVDNAMRWFTDFHIDALRLDAVHALVDGSPQHILAELADRTAQLAAHLGRPLSLIAESDRNDPATVQPTRSDGLGMTAQWADDVHHAIHTVLTGERQGYYVDFGSVDVLRKALRGVFVHDGTYSTFRHTVWGAPVPPEIESSSFVVFTQDHDQIGNRALGDRTAARLEPGVLAGAAALTLVSPYTPMLFQGEEWGASTPWQFFTDHDGDLAEAIRRGRAAEFGSHGWADLYGGPITVPDPQDPATYQASVLDWAEASVGQHQRLLTWYRTLTSLRRDLPPLKRADAEVTWVDEVPAPAPGPGGSTAAQTVPVRAAGPAGAPDPGGAAGPAGVLSVDWGPVQVVINLATTAQSTRFAAKSTLATFDPFTTLSDGQVILAPKSSAVFGQLRFAGNSGTS